MREVPWLLCSVLTLILFLQAIFDFTGEVKDVAGRGTGGRGRISYVIGIVGLDGVLFLP